MKVTARNTMSALIVALCGGVPAPGSDAAVTPAELTRMSWADLEAIYRVATPGRPPCGFAPGRVVYCPDSLLGGFKSRASQLVWRGKHFCPEQEALVNQWLGVRAIRASVTHGASWLDGNPAIILDYSATSRVWHNVRDEMREVAPGVYLGIMYVRQGAGPRPKLYFVLDARD